MSKTVFGWVAALFVTIGLLAQTAVAGATEADEAEIRDVTAGRLAALQAVDAVQYASFFCGDLRDAVEADWAKAFTAPRVSRFADANMKKLRGEVRKAFPLASDTTIDDFIRAVEEQDQDLFNGTWFQLWSESFAHLSFKVSSVTVNGDQADATITFRNTKGRGNEPRNFAREDGAWKDCTAQAATSETATAADVQARHNLITSDG